MRETVRPLAVAEIRVGADVFVPSGLAAGITTLEEGQHVAFRIIQKKGKPQADDVRIVEQPGKEGDRIDIGTTGNNKARQERCLAKLTSSN